MSSAVRCSEVGSDQCKSSERKHRRAVGNEFGQEGAHRRERDMLQLRRWIAARCAPFDPGAIPIMCASTGSTSPSLPKTARTADSRAGRSAASPASRGTPINRQRSCW